MTSGIKFPLIAILATLSLPSCTDHSGAERAKALEAEIEQLTQLNNQSEQTARRLQTQVEASREERDKLKEEKAKLEEQREAAAKEIEQIKKQFESYKVHYKLSMRQRSPGLHVDDFEVNGTAYRNVVLKELTDAYVNFSHEAGVAKLSVKLLPDPLQDMLGVNIPMADSATDHPMTSTDPRQINAARLNEHELAVTKAYQERVDIVTQIAEARTKLSEAKRNLDYANNTSTPVAPLKSLISQLQDKLARLQSKLAQADVNEYQARHEQPQILPVSR